MKHLQVLAILCLAGFLSQPRSGIGIAQEKSANSELKVVPQGKDVNGNSGNQDLVPTSILYERNALYRFGTWSIRCKNGDTTKSADPCLACSSASLAPSLTRIPPKHGVAKNGKICACESCNGKKPYIVPCLSLYRTVTLTNQSLANGLNARVGNSKASNPLHDESGAWFVNCSVEKDKLIISVKHSEGHIKRSSMGRPEYDISLISWRATEICTGPITPEAVGDEMVIPLHCAVDSEKYGKFEYDCELFAPRKAFGPRDPTTGHNGEFVPPKPCEDEVAKRLLNEDYSKEMRDKLAKLDKEGIRLQPLDDRERNIANVNSPFDTKLPFPTKLPFANYDRYGVTIPKDRLPVGFDPSAELARWGQNMNSIPKPGSPGAEIFTATNNFASTPNPLREGDVVSISIPLYPADIRVIATEVRPDRFRLSTATRPSGGKLLRHPVSGSREFGFARNADGSVTFYTQGVDTPINHIVNGFGAAQQKAGWEGMMQGFAERFGFSTEEAKRMVAEQSYSNQPIAERPDCYKPFTKRVE